MKKGQRRAHLTFGPGARRRYVCQDCGGWRMLSTTEVGRRCKPSCFECGGTFLVATNPETDSELSHHYDAARRVSHLETSSLVNAALGVRREDV